MCDLEKVAQQDSRLMRELGDSIGWDWLEQHADHYVDNPDDAMRNAAINAATWYVGGMLGGAGEAAGAGAAAAQTGAQAAQQATMMTAEELAKIAAQEAMNEGLMGAAKMMPQGFANSMEAGLMNTGYTPSSLANAFKLGPGSGQGMGRTLANFGANEVQGFTQMLKNNPMGLLSSGNKSDVMAKMQMAQMGMGMMNPQQQPQPMSAPPQRQAPQGPLNMPYGNSLNSMDMPPPGMSMEEWMRMKQMRGF